MKHQIIILLGLLVCTQSCSDHHEKKEIKQPNVLFISVDDLNDWIKPLGGHSQAITPNLDKLFNHGVSFTNAHCSQAVCTASRNSVLSGLHPTTTGWYASTKAMRTNYTEVMKDHMMLPEYFKNNGYNTYAAGKVFHDGESDHPSQTDNYWTEYSPHFWNNMEEHIKEAGFGYRGRMFYPFTKDGGQLVQLYGEDTINNYYKSNNRFYSLCGGPLSEKEIPKGGMYDEQIASWTIDKISKKQDKPFFMAAGFLRPHVPYTAPQKYFDMYHIDSIKIPDIPDDEMHDIPLMGKSIAFGRTPNGGWYDISRKKEILPELVHAYLACVTFVDDQIGKVLNALENSPNADNTIIVLWSDHGQHLGEKRHFRKQALWEESTRVPLFFKIPTPKNKKAQSHQVVSLLDIYPTLVDLCHLPKLPKLEGTSLVPLLENPQTIWDKPVLSTWYYKNHAIRSNNWRYIHYRNGEEELYNHQNDPGEHINLASDPQYAAIIEAHKKWLPKNNAIPAGKNKYTEDTLDKRIKEWIKNDSIPSWLR
ncbi:sulfatase [Saccharicrinis fermentans]|uniref:Arylsulfatase n=1 Tax=Saccharicrinis fermentans DSM 9555 = JCM 21142 TaxID=869213 RepID=W7Y6P3_9BACT|nr:sulfatase [Saccharicrinis fermentans]GAF03328.1 arylsulfatase [Saccharicrinis fermentans DSM 9555 = JCM 21142]